MLKEKILKCKLTDDQIGIFYLGQVGCLLKYRNNYLVVDPYLTDYVDRNCSSELVRWNRRYPAPMAPADLDFVDVVVCTHDHYDHMDPDTLQEIAACNSKAVFVAPDPVKHLLGNCGVPADRVIGAVDGETLEVGDFKIEPIPAAHEELHQDENGNYKELGYKIGCGDKSIYHAGDCCLYDGLTERLVGTNVLMLPVNGRSYYKRYVQDIIGNMTAEEAVQLAVRAGADLLIPLHFDLYDVNCLNPAQFVDTLVSNAPTQRFHIFVPGEGYILGE